MIELWIDIPNLQTVNLPDSFQNVQSKSITSICMNMNEWIDVSPILANLVNIQESENNECSSEIKNGDNKTRKRNSKNCIVFLV